jgi:hypothetical protein
MGGGRLDDAMQRVEVTFPEMEAECKIQDSDAFTTICSRFPDVQFTPEDLFLLLQPNAACGDLDKYR